MRIIGLIIYDNVLFVKMPSCHVSILGVRYSVIRDLLFIFISLIINIIERLYLFFVNFPLVPVISGLNFIQRLQEIKVVLIDLIKFFLSLEVVKGSQMGLMLLMKLCLGALAFRNIRWTVKSLSLTELGLLKPPRNQTIASFLSLYYW